MTTNYDDSADPQEQEESSASSTPQIGGQAELPARSVQRFSREQLPAPLLEALKRKGYATLTQVQASVAETETSEKDLRISSQTGSGKTVAVGIALGKMLLSLGSRASRAQTEQINVRAPEVLLLTPTRELASQVKRELAWLFADVPDAFVEVVTGGTSVGLERKSLSRGPRIVVATPGRALDHLQNGGFSGENVSYVVLDEADQMLDMGFRDELEGILELLPARKRTHLVSATFSGEVARIAQRYQSEPVRIEGTALGAANEDIEHVAHVVGNRHRYDALVNLLLKQRASLEEDEIGRSLVFTRTRADTLEIAERLQRETFKAEPLSGDLAQAQRTRTLGAFRSGRIHILVATDVAARGIDVQGVDLVVHFDPPSDPDAFTHRSGRTGRAGRKGTSVMLLPPQARGRLERIYRAAKVKPEWAPVPNADKIKKLYAKLGKRRLYAALEIEPDAEHLAYAQKLITEQDPAQVIARLLSFTDTAPPCPPREISEHFAVEGRSAERKKGDRRGRFEGEPRPFRSERGHFGGPPRPSDRGGEREQARPHFGGPPRGAKFRGPAHEPRAPFRGPRPDPEGGPPQAARPFPKKNKRFR